MSGCLNDYFSQIIDLVHEGGGDVVKFAGDALLCLWWDNDMPSQAVNAVQAACTICSQLDGYKVTDNIQLSLHAGLSSGSLNAVHVGGVQSRSIALFFQMCFWSYFTLPRKLPTYCWIFLSVFHCFLLYEYLTISMSPPHTHTNT